MVDDKTNQKIAVLRFKKNQYEVLFGESIPTYTKDKMSFFYSIEQMDVVETKWNFLFVGHWLQGDL